MGIFLAAQFIQRNFRMKKNKEENVLIVLQKISDKHNFRSRSHFKVKTIMFTKQSCLQSCLQNNHVYKINGNDSLVSLQISGPVLEVLMY